MQERIKINEWLNLGYHPAIDTYLSTENDAARILISAKHKIATSILDVLIVNLPVSSDLANQSINSIPAEIEIRIVLLNS